MVLSRARSPAVPAAVTIAATHVAVRRAVPIAVAALPVSLHGSSATEPASPAKALRPAWIGLSDGEIWSLPGGGNLTFVLGQLRADETTMERTFFDGGVRIG